MDVFARMDYNPRQPAAVACLSCRKLKMKCIGGGSPPCRRCLKNNRECVVRLPNRNQKRSSSSQTHTYRNNRPVPVSPASSSSNASVAREQHDRSPSLMQGQPSIDDESLGVPSIFSSSPLSIGTAKVSDSTGSLDGNSSFQRIDSDHLSSPIVCGLVAFFLQRLIFYVPVLSLEPVEDPSAILDRQQPLAYAMAFVASKFALGYSSSRKALYPHMLRLVEQANDVYDNTNEDNWTLLQALAVLYAYPEVAMKSNRERKRQLSIWAVKSAVETCAMQQSLHHSVGHLRELARESASNVSTSLPYRRTFYWLWLFVKSRHHSVITRTPPTIHNDSTITSTIDILMHLELSQSVWRILAEASLHRMWDQAALRDKDLGEWWCMPSSTKDIGSLQELLNGTEEMLQEWSSSWLRSSGAHNISTRIATDDEPHIASFVTPFMGLLTRFNMISFAAPIISQQLRAKPEAADLTSITLSSPEFMPFLDCVLRSADAASNCCDSIIDMNPTAREFLRYTPDYGFTMIALCCLHLVYAYSMSPSNPTLREYLEKAEHVAHLMMEVGGPNQDLPNLYGDCILSHLRKSALPIDASDGQVLADDRQQERVANQEDLRVPQMPGEQPIPLDLHDQWPGQFSADDLIGPFHGQLPDLFNIYSSMLLNSNLSEL